MCVCYNPPAVSSVSLRLCGGKCEGDGVIYSGQTNGARGCHGSGTAVRRQVNRLSGSESGHERTV